MSISSNSKISIRGSNHMAMSAVFTIFHIPTRSMSLIWIMSKLRLTNKNIQFQDLKLRAVEPQSSLRPIRNKLKCKPQTKTKLLLRTQSIKTFLYLRNLVGCLTIKEASETLLTRQLRTTVQTCPTSDKA